MKLEQVLRRPPEKHERLINKFWASEINSIIRGYLAPKDYFKEKEINYNGLENIFWGEALEHELASRLTENNISVKLQERKEIEFDKGLFLVVKPDFLFSDYLIEAKCPVEPLGNIPDRYKFQLEAEYRAFNKQVYLLSFQRPIAIFSYQPNENLWSFIRKELANYHKKLLKIWKLSSLLVS